MKPSLKKQFRGSVQMGCHSQGIEKAKHKKRHKKVAKKESGTWTVEPDVNVTKQRQRIFAAKRYDGPLEPSVLSKLNEKSSKLGVRKAKRTHPMEAAIFKRSRCRSESEEPLGGGEGSKKKKYAKSLCGPLSLHALKQLGKLGQSPKSVRKSRHEPADVDSESESPASEEYEEEPDVEDGHQSESEDEASDVESSHQSGRDGTVDYFETTCAHSSNEEDNSSNEEDNSSNEEDNSSNEEDNSSEKASSTCEGEIKPNCTEEQDDGYTHQDLHSKVNKSSLRVFRLGTELLLAFVEQPTNLQLTGRATLRVLYGTLNIDGYLLTPSNPLNKEGLFIQCGLLSPPTTMKPMAPQSDSICSRLVEELELLAPGAWDTVSPQFDGKATVVVLRRAEGHWPAMELVVSKTVELPELSSSHASLGFDLSAEEDKRSWSSQFAGLAMKLIKAATSAEQQVPHVVVCGVKDSGKSTLSRLLTNSLLNVCPEVMYFDTDPGQTEFSPPGTLSLVKVTHPLLGPPFAHVSTPEKMYFLGDVSPAASPDSYSSAVRSLVEHKNQHFGSIPLVVNTMGWLSGIGLSLFVDVIRWVNPTDLAQLASATVLAGTTEFTDLPLLTASNLDMFCGWLSSRSEESSKHQKTLLRSSLAFHHFKALGGIGSLSSKHAQLMRQGMLLSYLGQKERFCGFCPWSQTPYRLPWSSVAIHEHSSRVHGKDLLYVLNGNIVALCKVPREVLLETEVEGYPMFMRKNPPYECLGFAIVRAIDPAEKVFYILTPEPKHRLADVNALVKGSINIPDVLLAKQARFMREMQSLPYLVETTTKEETSTNHVEPRSRSESPCY